MSVQYSVRESTLELSKTLKMLRGRDLAESVERLHSRMEPISDWGLSITVSALRLVYHIARCLFSDLS